MLLTKPKMLAVALAMACFSRPLIYGTPAPKKKPPKTDTELIQGIWKVAKIKANGKHTGQEINESQEWAINQEKITMTYYDGTQDEANYKLEPKQNPKTIDLSFTTRFKGLTFHGIYELSGNKLKLVYTKAQARRPVAFRIGDMDRGSILFMFERKEAGAKKN
jgi:uncharacterized protein (TIGR03067 family)